MNTEITDKKNRNGWVFFDAECNLCSTLAHRFEPLLLRHRFALLPLQTPWVKERLAKGDKELLAEMRLLTSSGVVYGGVEALAEIAGHIWSAKPLYWVSRVPLARWALGQAYGWVGRNRTCLGGSCLAGSRPRRSPVGALGWLCALLPTALAVSLGGALPAWVWMWVMALALFFGAKWITILRLLRSGNSSGPRRLLAYALLWPGMDARAFCGRAVVPKPFAGEWALAAAKVLLGAALIWFGGPLTRAANPLITGWVGMIGIVLLLHFGLFHLLSLFWRALGINARPIMRSPAAATSLSQFWGGSWNAAFSDLVHENLLKPLARQLGLRGALFLVFLVSGGLHELVISMPARSGYGLPTAYFVLQGLVLVFERSKPGLKLGIRCGLRGWGLVVVVAAVPAFWLFHPVFIHNVILPMLHAIGAT